MTKPSNSISTFCAALILTGALLLAPLPSAHGSGSVSSKPATPALAGWQEAPAAADPAKAKDPCKHSEKHSQKTKKQCPPEQMSGGVARGDFNGDGFGDLAVGAPLEDVGNIISAGAVNVLYGSASRLTATGTQLWHQDVDGIFDQAEGGDAFGNVLY